MAEYSLFNVLPKWYYYATLFMYLLYWPMSIMISLTGSYDSDYARVYQIRPNDTLTITNMQDCYDYIQLEMLTDVRTELEFYVGGNGCTTYADTPCIITDFSSGIVTVKSSVEQERTVRFALECNTNFKQTVQFYTTAISIVCMVLAFVLIANCLLITCMHNVIVCVCRLSGNDNGKRGGLSPPIYSKKRDYQPIQ